MNGQQWVVAVIIMAWVVWVSIEWFKQRWTQKSNSRRKFKI
ncbi:hypothetical protein [Adhaeribacter radiodurans]|nr:hypothetical protein [Adhaeribacter radiodurans]